MSAYTERNKILRIIGYKNYKHYLRSPLWKAIRDEHINKNSRCYCCGKTATQVHHTKYTSDILLGINLQHNDIVSICGKCHHKSEFTKEKKKRSMNVANGIVKSKHNSGPTIFKILNGYNRYLDISVNDAQYKVSIDGLYEQVSNDIVHAVVAITRNVAGKTISIGSHIVDFPPNINESVKSIEKELKVYKLI